MFGEAQGTFGHFPDAYSLEEFLQYVRCQSAEHKQSAKNLFDIPRAAYFVHWPGSALTACEYCASRAQRVAEVMGFTLVCQPIREYVIAIGEVIIIERTEKMLAKVP